MTEQHRQLSLIAQKVLTNLVNEKTQQVCIHRHNLILFKIDPSKFLTQFIRRSILRISVLSSVILFTSCGVNKDEYNKVLSENVQLKKENFQLKKGNIQLKRENIQLKERLDLSKIKANISKLKLLFNEYHTGGIDSLVSQIEEIDPHNNLSKFSDLYGDLAGLIVNTLLNIVELNQSYKIEITQSKERLKSLENDIKNKKHEIETLENEDYKYINARIIRRFDTEPQTNKGYYEAYETSANYRKIVIIADEKEAKPMYNSRKEILVKSLGEQATTVTQSTAYRSNEVTEYYEYFITVDDSKNPFAKKNELSEQEKIYSKLKEEFSNTKRLLIKEIEKNTKSNINKILDKM